MRVRSILAASASVGAMLGLGLATIASAASETPRANWSIRSVAEPTSFNAADTQDTVDELVVTATGGHYKLHPGIAANPTHEIEWDAPASKKEEVAGGPESVEKALEELPEVGAGNVTVTGGRGDAGGSKPYRIAWTGALSGAYPGFLAVEESELEDGGGSGSAAATLVAEASTRDRIAVAIVNVGSSPSEGTITVTDDLPAGLNPIVEEPQAPEVIEPVLAATHRGECAAESKSQVRCTYSRQVLPGRELVLHINVAVTSPSLTGSLVNSASVAGGGGEDASTSSSNPVNANSTPFGLTGFTFEADGVAGTADLQAGDHPYGVTTTIDLDTVLEHLGGPVVAQDVKDVAVELPFGFAGDPLAAERCPEIDLTNHEGNANTPGFHTACPPGSQVGTISVVWAGGLHTIPYPVYNVVPERGYPAELGFNITSGLPIFLYASVVRDGRGYRLRVANPGGLRVDGDEPAGIRTEFFGDPGAENETGSRAAFVTNPTSCPTEPLNVRTYVTSWEGGSASAEATAYPELMGCNLLQGSAAFDSSLALEPETTQADTPSGYTADVKLPQAPSVFGALATPELKDATITLPPGMSISPSAASGPDALAGCPATGADGINIGSDEVAPDGQDLGDPEATELGEGHPGAGGNGSPYDDGMWHAAPGHCPQNSRVGEVEVKTPDLAEPLHGHMFLAQPSCGGAGQPVCTEEAAETGGVFGLYLEITGKPIQEGGSGVIVKVPGTLEVGGLGAHSSATGLAPGQLRVKFIENPQFPLEEVKVTTSGGPRAPLANPQSCGTATTTTVLEPWSGGVGSDSSGPPAEPSWPLTVTGCTGGFAPAFTAGMSQTLHGGSYSPFALEFSRNDGEQDLSGLSVTMPPGLAGKISGFAECGEAELAAAIANTGSCPASSRVGTATAAAGSGSTPFYQSGPVFLTGPYRGGPFGLAVVVPANAGPYHLGNVVVRAAIYINPTTAAVSVISDPLPQMIDGVPLRLQHVQVTVGEAGNFTFNATNCARGSVGATISSAQGASVPTSAPYGAASCGSLGFAPKFAVSTSGKTSKADGASLTTTVTEPAGAQGTQANIHYVKVELPKALPSRLTTLQKACTAKAFETNPASCPPESFIGHAVVHTALLPVPLEGPAIFVSHGGEAFPSLEMVLQGDNVTIELVGTTFISKAGITSTTFKTVPDLPFNTFSLTLPEEKFSAFAANGNLCTEQSGLKLPVQFVGQNGATLNQDAQVSVTGCKPEIHVVKHSVKGKTATIQVSVPSAGKLVATGKGLSKASKSTSSATGATLTVTLTLSKAEAAFLAKHKGRKLEAKIHLSFKPSKGKALSKTLSVVFKK